MKKIGGALDVKWLFFKKKMFQSVAYFYRLCGQLSMHVHNYFFILQIVFISFLLIHFHCLLFCFDFQSTIIFIIYLFFVLFYFVLFCFILFCFFYFVLFYLFLWFFLCGFFEPKTHNILLLVSFRV